MQVTNLFVVGPQRSGTTWIYELLATQDEEIYLDRIEKENYFFARNRRGSVEKNRARFIQKLSGSGEKRVHADVCSTYLGDEMALTRIAEAFPDALVVYINRDEAARRRSFEQHRRFNRFGLWAIGDTIDWKTFDRQSDIQECEAQIRTIFPEKNLLRLEFEDLKRDDGQPWVDALEKFVGMPLSPLPPGAINASRNSDSLPKALMVAAYRVVQRTRLHILAQQLCPGLKRLLKGSN